MLPALGAQTRGSPEAAVTPAGPDQFVVSVPIRGATKIPVLIEPGVESAAFAVECDADLSVFRPDGTRLPSAPKRSYIIALPPPGLWHMHVANVPRECRVHAAVRNNRLHLSAGLAQKEVQQNTCFLVSASASASRPIAGCHASVRTVDPNGRASDVPLADQGGLYQSRVCNFARGVHHFQVTVECREGLAYIRNEGPPGIGPFPATPPLFSFERTVSFTGVVQ